MEQGEVLSFSLPVTNLHMYDALNDMVGTRRSWRNTLIASVGYEPRHKRGMNHTKGDKTQHVLMLLVAAARNYEFQQLQWIQNHGDAILNEQLMMIHPCTQFWHKQHKFEQYDYK